MVQEQWIELKMKFLSNYIMKIVISGGEGKINLWWGVYCGGFFQVGGRGGISNFLASGVDSPLPSSEENPEE